MLCRNISAFCGPKAEANLHTYKFGGKGGHCVGDVRRATELYRQARRNPARARDRLAEALKDPDALLRHVAGVLVAQHYPTDLPKQTIREMLNTLIRECTPRADLPPIIHEYARLSEGNLPESELDAIFTRVQAAMDEYQQRNPPSPISLEYTQVTTTKDDCNDLGQDIALALARLPASSANFAIPPLLKLWRQARQFYEAALAAIALSFPPTAAKVAASRLSAIQRAVLHALTEDVSIWTFCGDTAPMLADRSLPTTRQAMRKYLRAGNKSA